MWAERKRKEGGRKEGIRSSQKKKEKRKREGVKGKKKRMQDKRNRQTEEEMAEKETKLLTDGKK